MLPDLASCVDARKRRDASLAGVLFAGDGQRFCVPHCQTRVPAQKRMQFFASAAAALVAGLQPCKKCDPLAAPRLPDWRISQPTVVRALRLIWSGFLRTGSLAALAQRVELTAGQLRKLFIEELGASPAAIAQTYQRQITMTLKPARGSDRLSLTIPVREPYAAGWVFDFLDRRSLPGLEEVVDGIYRRRLSHKQWLSVGYSPGQLHIELPRSARAASAVLVGRISHVFDVHADPLRIDPVLAEETWLESQVSGGIRVPGAWDGFETAVRAILGQQVSVARARNLAIDLMQRFGSDGFPTPAELVNADVAAVGMPGKRGAAVRELAAAVLDGRLLLDNSEEPQQQFETLCALPGIGPWTAGYVAMRIAGDADAFPRGDWVILKQLGMTAAVAQRYSQQWQPFRAYALMYIWQASSAPSS